MSPSKVLHVVSPVCTVNISGELNPRYTSTCACGFGFNSASEETLNDDIFFHVNTEWRKVEPVVDLEHEEMVTFDRSSPK